MSTGSQNIPTHRALGAAGTESYGAVAHTNFYPPPPSNEIIVVLPTYTNLGITTKINQSYTSSSRHNFYLLHYHQSVTARWVGVSMFAKKENIASTLKKRSAPSSCAALDSIYRVH